MNYKVVQKYPTRQNAISRQVHKIFLPKFPHLYKRDPVIILKIFNKLVVSLKIIDI